MSLPSGLASQAGFTIETNYGVLATPATFVPVVSDSLDADDTRSESEGVIAGMSVLGSNQWTPSARNVGGDFGTELYDRGIGKLFRLLFGGIVTTGSGPYTHTFTPGTLPSCTWQMGRPANDGTVHPYNFLGMKAASGELACKADEIVTLGITFMGRDMLFGSRVVTDGVLNSTTLVTSATAAFTQADVGKLISATGITAGTTIAAVVSATNITLSAAATATATSVSVTVGAPLATASYAAGQLPVHFKHASLSLGAVTQYFEECTLKIENGLSERRPAPGSVLGREPLPADLRSYMIDIKGEFDDLTTQTAYRAGTEAALALVFTIGTSTVTISGNVRYDQNKVNHQKGILSKGITAVLVNGDSTP